MKFRKMTIYTKSSTLPQLAHLTQLLQSKQGSALPEQHKEDSKYNLEMQKSLALQNQQLLDISNTIQELKQTDHLRHEDLVDFKALLTQHQTNNAFSKVYKTLSATDIEAALKVSDQIDDRIKDHQFEVLKTSKQKMAHPDVSELLGSTDLDFEG